MYLLVNKISCQPVCNKLGIEPLQEEFRAIETLEKTQVSRCILFKKVLIMPKVQAFKIKGTIYNVLVEDAKTYCNTLPRPADSNGLVIVKLKRKIEYRGHVLFESVRPELVF